MTVFWLIRHRASGHCFPQFQGAQTHYQFLVTDKRPPRLWTSRGAARSWLTKYCKGPMQTVTGSDDDFWGNPVTVKVGLRHHADLARNRFDFEIIPATITVEGGTL